MFVGSVCIIWLSIVEAAKKAEQGYRYQKWRTTKHLAEGRAFNRRRKPSSTSLPLKGQGLALLNPLNTWTTLTTRCKKPSLPQKLCQHVPAPLTTKKDPFLLAKKPTPPLQALMELWLIAPKWIWPSPFNATLLIYSCNTSNPPDFDIEILSSLMTPSLSNIFQLSLLFVLGFRFNLGAVMLHILLLYSVYKMILAINYSNEIMAKRLTEYWLDN